MLPVQSLATGMSRSLYHRLANDTLLELSERFENMSYDGDVDYQEGNLQFKVPGIGEYVFNKQPPTMQIWASSPLTGPAKFRIDSRSGWIEQRHNVPFNLYIEEELRRIRDRLGDPGAGCASK